MKSLTFRCVYVSRSGLQYKVTKPAR